MSLILALWACVGPDPSGTAVGNPGDMDVAARAVDPDVGLAEVEVDAALLLLHRCDGATVPVAAEAVLDGLAPSEVPVAVPGGPWCALELVLSGPVRVTGATGAGTLFTAALDVGVIGVRGDVVVDGEQLLVDLPVPIDAATLDGLGPDVVLAADDPLALTWAEEASREAALYEDVDGDGVVALSDRVIASATVPDTALSAAYGADAQGCGCATPTPRLGWLAVVAILAIGRRRPGVGVHRPSPPGDRWTGLRLDRGA